MALLTLIPGKKFRIWLGTAAAGPFTLVKGMNAYDKTTNRTSDSFDTFDMANAFQEPGPREKGYTVNGGLIPDDPGQLIARDAEAIDELVYAKVTPMGGDADLTEKERGYTHAVKVGTLRHGATTTGPQTWGFDLLSQGDEVITAGGYVV